MSLTIVKSGIVEPAQGASGGSREELLGVGAVRTQALLLPSFPQVEHAMPGPFSRIEPVLFTQDRAGWTPRVAPAAPQRVELHDDQR